MEASFFFDTIMPRQAAYCHTRVADIVAEGREKTAQCFFLHSSRLLSQRQKAIAHSICHMLEGCHRRLTSLSFLSTADSTTPCSRLFKTLHREQDPLGGGSTYTSYLSRGLGWLRSTEACALWKGKSYSAL
ncbi:hypothetical protein VTN02DRAFT_3654 [Thermoascus thermophilus]